MVVARAEYLGFYDFDNCARYVDRVVIRNIHQGL